MPQEYKRTLDFTPIEFDTAFRLKVATNLYELADLLGVPYKHLTYVLYKIPDSRRYSELEIPKSDGSTRKILRPTKKLKSLQGSLSSLLYEVRESASQKEGSLKASSHGYEKDRSPFTNASKHVGRRYVLNLDLKDFFPSIHIGRVIGILKADRSFELNDNIALAIAQLACFNGSLPQGAPSSPVISNIVAGVLDRRLRKFANLHRCSYSRYVDDITFSTNLRDFPEDIARPQANGTWVVSESLEKVIKRSGFEVNHSKVRMCLAESKQTVTGLTVNSSVSTDRKYKKITRAMCHSLFQKGSYVIDGVKHDSDSLKPLDGRLSHIARIAYLDRKRRSKNQTLLMEEIKRLNDYSSYERLLEQLIFYQNFVVPSRPIIVTEGYTDFAYLRFVSRYRGLLPGVLKDSSKNIHFQLFKPTYRNQTMIRLGSGAGVIGKFILRFEDRLKNFSAVGIQQPVIFILDNDDAGREQLQIVTKKRSNKKLEVTSITDQVTKIGQYQYVLMLNHEGYGGQIEDYFKSSLLNKKYQGQSFSFLSEDGETGYSKGTFAKHVVPKHCEEADCTDFSKIWSSIACAVEDSITNLIPSDQA